MNIGVHVSFQIIIFFWIYARSGIDGSCGKSIFSFFFFFCLFFAISWATPVAYGGSQARGQIRAVASGLHCSHSNVRCLTHWARLGIEPTSSWILVGFVTTESQGELLFLGFWGSSILFLYWLQDLHSHQQCVCVGGVFPFFHTLFNIEKQKILNFNIYYIEIFHILANVFCFKNPSLPQGIEKHSRIFSAKHIKVLFLTLKSLILM